MVDAYALWDPTVGSFVLSARGWPRPIPTHRKFSVTSKYKVTFKLLSWPSVSNIVYSLLCPCELVCSRSAVQHRLLYTEHTWQAHILPSSNALPRLRRSFFSLGKSKHQRAKLRSWEATYFICLPLVSCYAQTRTLTIPILYPILSFWILFRLCSSSVLGNLSNALPCVLCDSATCDSSH